jgi:hypothetical protein
VPLLWLLLYICGSDKRPATFPWWQQEPSQKDKHNLAKSVERARRRSVKSMGYNPVNDIDVHLIRKGTASFLVPSLPGGPPSAAICLQGGWTKELMEMKVPKSLGSILRDRLARRATSDSYNKREESILGPSMGCRHVPTHDRPCTRTVY